MTGLPTLGTRTVRRPSVSHDPSSRRKPSIAPSAEVMRTRRGPESLSSDRTTREGQATSPRAKAAISPNRPHRTCAYQTFPRPCCHAWLVDFQADATDCERTFRNSCHLNGGGGGLLQNYWPDHQRQVRGVQIVIFLCAQDGPVGAVVATDEPTATLPPSAGHSGLTVVVSFREPRAAGPGRRMDAGDRAFLMSGPDPVAPSGMNRCTHSCEENNDKHETKTNRLCSVEEGGNER